MAKRVEFKKFLVAEVDRQEMNVVFGGPEDSAVEQRNYEFYAKRLGL